ncbi:MAG: hypothetical protein ACTS22_08510 [Phycisphaerales bacterium]
MMNPIRWAAAAVVSLATGAASAQPFEIVLEYRIGTAGANQVLIDEGLAGALITERIIGDSSQLPAATNPFGSGAEYRFEVQRVLTISERTNGGPDVVASPRPQSLRIFDRDPGNGLPDSFVIPANAVSFDGLALPPFGAPTSLQTTGLTVVALDDTTFQVPCEPTLGDLLKSFDPRTIDDGRFTTSTDMTFASFYSVGSTAEVATIVSGEIEIVAHPQTAIVPFGTPTVGFDVLADTVTDVPVIDYQWRKDGADIVDGPGIVGANSPTLTVDADPANLGVYDCVLTTFSDQRVTLPASFVLTGTAPSPDYNGDGAVDYFDVIKLIEDIEAF